MDEYVCDMILSQKFIRIEEPNDWSAYIAVIKNTFFFISKPCTLIMIYMQVLPR